ncbi:MAG: hypothetical protein EBQ82_04325 [Betaproteobacteria bacterium]|nr:hypothetical protein [Betaproteobacteria bacterium]NBY04627.1 hypothetical protein [Betaproteobacteria bacterium]
MVDFVNVLLRALMCMAFIVWVVRPMLMTFSRKEFDQAEIEEAAQMAITSAFQAYGNNNANNYYNNPQLAVFMAQNPGLPIPTEAEMAQRQQAELEKAQADELAAQQAADKPSEEAQTDAGDSVTMAPADGEVTAVADAQTGADAAASVTDGSEQLADDVLVVEDEEEREGETLEQMRERVKLENKQKKPTIPPELLQNANSYEDQLMVVRMIVDQEHSRVASVIRSMIQVK